MVPRPATRLPDRSAARLATHSINRLLHVNDETATVVNDILIILRRPFGASFFCLSIGSSIDTFIFGIQVMDSDPELPDNFRISIIDPPWLAY